MSMKLGATVGPHRGQRKRTLTKAVRGASLAIAFNDHYEGGGEIVFAQACKLGCEGIALGAQPPCTSVARSDQAYKLVQAPGAHLVMGWPSAKRAIWLRPILLRFACDGWGGGVFDFEPMFGAA
jgi:hypothetical protein